MLGRVGTILDLIEMHMPKMMEVLRQIATLPLTPASAYQDLVPVSFDRGVLEHAITELTVMPVDIGWRDLGTPERFTEGYPMTSAKSDSQRSETCSKL